MIRKIIHIDEEKCNGCGICTTACHEGAIEIISGKAKLVREHFCDGLGDCLPSCPMGAITFEEREAPAYDEKAVLKAKQEKEQREAVEIKETAFVMQSSQLRNWPVEIKLSPITAPYFQGANLLIAADCTAYAYAAFHRDFIQGKITLIGCPKLDAVDYSEKLTAILANNDIASVTIVRMEVPCCGGLEMATKKALQKSGKCIPCQVIILSIEGKVSSFAS